MSLAATLAASGMRPASFVPTIKCSNCGDEIEISAMGEHQCTKEPLSPSAASANLSNPFMLRQMNASETKPAQPSPLQFSGDQPPSTTAGRPRATTAGSSQISIASQNKASRPSLPRINSAVANQPFLGPTTVGPISPASSVRSGSSGSSKRPPQRAVSKPVPRIFDPRPPSPELTANMDCAFPPFPTTPVTSERKPSSASSHRRKTSGGSSAHRRKGSGGTSSSHRRKTSSESRSSRKQTRPDHDTAEARSPSLGGKENPLERIDTGSDRSGTTSLRSSKDDRLTQDAKVFDQRPSQQVEQLTPVDEHPPVMLPIPAPLSPHMNAPLSAPLIAPSVPPLNPQSNLTLAPPSSAPSSTTFDHILPPTSPLMEGPSQGLFPPPGERREISSSHSTKSEEGGLSISNSIRRAVSRKLSLKKVTRSKSIKTEEAVPSMPEIILQPFEPQPGQRRIPPQRPARPDEGLPDELLHSATPGDFSEFALPPQSPAFSPDAERSKTVPIPTWTVDEPLSPNPLSKMASEPALRSQGGFGETLQSDVYQAHDQTSDESRIDYRIHDAPPVPKPVQIHREESRHKSSDSTTSTASSFRSLGDISVGNSNTTTGTSPVVSATSSVDASLPFASQSARSSGDEDLHVAALNVNTQQKYDQEIEPPEETPTLPALEATDDAQSDEELPAPNAHMSSSGDTWPLESPMDPSLQDGRLGEDNMSPRSSPSDATLTQLAPESQNLERLSSDVYVPKRPSVSSTETEKEQPIINEPESSTNPEFLGFNFEMPSPLHLQQSEGTPSPFESPLEAEKPASPATNEPEESSELETQPSDLPQPPPIPESDEARPLLNRRSTGGVRPICRGCTQPIEGKSIKAADGRLTGRWHKTCFVCTDCKQPFETTQFYVINNLPYCEQHYHEKNGSVCHNCHLGIEGQFFQTTSGPNGSVVRKYHRRCFTCVDCRLVLSEDYFEVNGRVHCERHAFAAMRSQSRRIPPGGGPPGMPGSRLRGESFKAVRQRPKQMQ